MLDLLRTSISWVSLLLATPLVIYFLVLTLACLFTSRGNRKGTAELATKQRRIAVLVPAHNESLLIEETVAAILEQDYPREHFSLTVIADNCNDDTATKARTAGANVIERHEDPGKGQALNCALEQLLQQPWDAFLIVDADSLLHKQGLAAIDQAMTNGAPVVQLRYGIRNAEASIRARSAELGLASFNGIRPAGRTALGMSSSIFGNGFCISREALEQVPYMAHSIVEDLEYHILLLKGGFRVHFSDAACVYAQMPTGAEDSQPQRVRWERGRIAMIQQYASGLWRQMLRGNKLAAEGFVDVIMPPSSLIALACLIPLLLGPGGERVWAMTLIGLLGFHFLVAAWRYGSVPGLLRISLYLPWYISWKTFVIIRSLITQKNLPWIRTTRHKNTDSQ